MSYVVYPADSPRTRRASKLAAKRRIRASVAAMSFAVCVPLACSFYTFAQAVSNTTSARPRVEGRAKDLSGVWSGENAITFSPEAPPLQPWAEAKFKTVKPGYGPRASWDSNDPVLDCLPPGMPRILLMPFPDEIVQMPSQVIMLFEYDHFVRHIYTDRRGHPLNMKPTWMGDSIGNWQGDTLVVDTVGFNDKSWLDQVGHPHSDALHLVEHIRRVDRETLQDDIEIDDPKAYSRIWNGQQTFKLRPGWHLREFICEDHMDDPGR
jgi:hypothetical protein